MTTSLLRRMTVHLIGYEQRVHSDFAIEDGLTPMQAMTGSGKLDVCIEMIGIRGL